MNVSGDILNAGGNVVDQEYYGFTGSFFNISPIVIDDINNFLIKMRRTQMLNNDEQQLNHPICDNIFEI